MSLLKLSLAAVVMALASVPCASVHAAAEKPPDYTIADAAWGDVYFAKGSHELTPEAKKTLDGLAAWLKGRPDSVVMLAGYDGPGLPEKESIELGWSRAKAVGDYLVKQGADGSKIKTISFGNTKIAVPGEDEEAMSKNRRVRYRVAGPVDMEKMQGPPSGVCQRCKK